MGETIARVRELAEQIDRPEHLVPRIYGQWAFYFLRSEHKLALSLAEALAVARRQSAQLFEPHAATSLARLWRDQGKRTEARDLLAPIYGWFTEGFDAPVLTEAKSLLEQLTP